jgi:hypothetical protein
MRVPIRVEGASGGWITSSGLVVVSPGELLRHLPTIELRGQNTLFEHFGRGLHVRAQLANPGQPPRDVAATMTPPGPEYRILVHLDKADIRTDQDVHVKILFDEYVVPKDVGAFDDLRQLVVATPTQVRAIRN